MKGEISAMGYNPNEKSIINPKITYDSSDFKKRANSKNYNKNDIFRYFDIIESSLIGEKKDIFVYTAEAFFNTSSCVYYFEKLLLDLDIIKNVDNKIYLYNEGFNYWEQMNDKNKLISIIRLRLQNEYKIDFDILEVRGFSINPKLRTLISNIQISKDFNMTKEEFEAEVLDSHNYINFKNGLFDIENKIFIGNRKLKKDQYFFDGYIDSNYNLKTERDLKDLYDNRKFDSDKYLEKLLSKLSDIAPNFYKFFETSLRGDVDKLMQFGQHLVYSITTKTDETKAKEVLLMLGGHDVGKSCLIDLCTSYFPKNKNLVSHLAPTGFKNAAVRSKLFTVKLNTTHETSSERNLPVSEFNKTVWINQDEAIANGKLYSGNYIQLHQIYAANDFFKVKEQYNPEDYLPKINLLLIDGTHEIKDRIPNLSSLIVEERDAIITFFLNAKFLVYFDNKALFLTVYDLLKENKFMFLEKEDAIEFKENIKSEYYYQMELAKQKKEEKKLVEHERGLDSFLENLISYEFTDDFLNQIREVKFLEDAIKMISKEVDDEYKISFDNLFKEYKTFCEMKNFKSYKKSLFKKELHNRGLHSNIIIESNINNTTDDIDYEKNYKKIIKTQEKIYIYKKFKHRVTGENKIGYIGFKVKY